MTAEKKSGKAPSFEKSMERLESIVGDMEGGALSLDVMIERFEEGQSLIRFCTGKLDEVERKIEKLLTKDGEVETEAFGEPEPAPEAPPVDLLDADEGLLL
jgi:exodeoxyribonuclease VII small subunit